MNIKIIFLLSLILSFKAYTQDSDPAQPPTSSVSSDSGGTPVPEIQASDAVRFPKVRPRSPNDPQKESSSFVGDHENLDPMRTQKESLKDDDEPILEDIKQIIDAPSTVRSKKITKKIKSKESNENSEKLVIEKSTENINESQIQKSEDVSSQNVSKNKSVNKKSKKKLSKKNNKKKKLNTSDQLQDDDPDLAIEKRFYQNFIKFNSLPTSVEMWTKATSERKPNDYIVQKGDTLWTISETLFADAQYWPKIWALNRQGILNPHFIFPGMIVHFYPGSANSLPTLAVGDNKLDSDSKITSTSFNAGSESHKEQNMDLVVNLPQSLPEYKSSLYYGKKRKVEIIDLKEEPTFSEIESPDIILTDRLVLTDIKISTESDINLSCHPGEIIHNFEFLRKPDESVVVEYAILEALPVVRATVNEIVYPYKQVGNLIAYGQKKLKIKNCHSYLNRHHLFVPKNLVQNLKSKKISKGSPQIIGGPTVLNQNYFSSSEFVYVNMGPLSYNSGDLFSIRSNRIDETVGQIKILDSFGSFALALITNADNSIKVGDAILQK